MLSHDEGSNAIFKIIKEEDTEAHVWEFSKVPLADAIWLI